MVYWGRWADATGEIGRWSQTVTARVEAWSPAPGTAVPAPCAPGEPGRVAPVHAWHGLAVRSAADGV